MEITEVEKAFDEWMDSISDEEFIKFVENSPETGVGRVTSLSFVFGANYDKKE